MGKYIHLVPLVVLLILSVLPHSSAGINYSLDFNADTNLETYFSNIVQLDDEAELSIKEEASYDGDYGFFMSGKVDGPTETIGVSGDISQDWNNNIYLHFYAIRTRLVNPVFRIAIGGSPIDVYLDLGRVEGSPTWQILSDIDTHIYNIQIAWGEDVWKSHQFNIHGLLQFALERTNAPDNFVPSRINFIEIYADSAQAQSLRNIACFDEITLSSEPILPLINNFAGTCGEESVSVEIGDEIIGEAYYSGVSSSESLSEMSSANNSVGVDLSSIDFNFPSTVVSISIVVIVKLVFARKTKYNEIRK